MHNSQLHNLLSTLSVNAVLVVLIATTITLTQHFLTPPDEKVKHRRLNRFLEENEKKMTCSNRKICLLLSRLW